MKGKVLRGRFVLPVPSKHGSDLWQRPCLHRWWAATVGLPAHSEPKAKENQSLKESFMQMLLAVTATKAIFEVFNSV